MRSPSQLPSAAHSAVTQPQIGKAGLYTQFTSPWPYSAVMPMSTTICT